MDAYLGIDIGTSGVKVLALSPEGEILAKAFAAQDVSMPKTGWAEQDPAMYINSIKKAVNDLVSKTDADIKCIGLSGQMLGSIFMDADNKPLMPCIIWIDSRADEQSTRLLNDYGMDFWIEKAGTMPLSSYWAAKLLWMKENMPEIYEKTRTVLFPKDYVRFYLTGEIATEVADASATTLFDMKKRCWSSEIISLLGLDIDKLPKTMWESADIAGTLTKKAAAELGLKEGISVIAGGGDQSMGGIGNGIVEDGLLACTIGTSGVVFTSTDVPFEDKLPRAALTYCHAIRNKWCFFGCTNAAGASFQWLKNTMANEESRLAAEQNMDVYDLLTRKAAKSEIGSKGLTFLPYLNGERTPYPDADAKGVFFGLTARHNFDDIIRSVMEGITFSLRQSVDIMREHGVTPKRIHASGGGAKSDFWLDMQANVFNTEIVRMNIDEGPACGAAISAMVAKGVYSTEAQACGKILRPAIIVEPTAEKVKKYNEAYLFYSSLYPVLKDSFSLHGEMLRKNI